MSMLTWFMKLMWVVSFVSVVALLSVLALILISDLKGSWYWKKRGGW
jgi:hypothetical protein